MDGVGTKSKRSAFRQCLVLGGHGCITIGLLLLAAALAGFVDPAAFNLGGESGFRVIGAIAVFGCIIAAIGYFDE